MLKNPCARWQCRKNFSKTRPKDMAGVIAEHAPTCTMASAATTPSASASPVRKRCADAASSRVLATIQRPARLIRFLHVARPSIGWADASAATTVQATKIVSGSASGRRRRGTMPARRASTSHTARRPSVICDSEIEKTSPSTSMTSSGARAARSHLGPRAAGSAPISTRSGCETRATAS